MSDNDWPECEEFYNLMQAYRHARVVDQDATIAAYKDVKDWMRAEIERNREAIAELVGALDYTARRLQVDIDDGSRPDQWSMEDIVRRCRTAIAKYDKPTKETK